MEGGRDVPRGRVAGRPDVLLGAAPPDAPEVIDREAVLLRLLEGRRARLPPVPLEHVVRPVVAGDVDPGRALLDAGRRQREVPELEAPLPGEALEDGDRLAAVRHVQMQEGDLLALDLFGAALLQRDVVDHRRRLRPVRRHDRKQVRPGPSLGRVRAAVAEGQERDPVALRPVGQRVRDASRERREEDGPALVPLVALDAAGRVVGGLALLPLERDAVEAPLGVDEREVVLHAAADAAAAGGERPGAIDHERQRQLLRGPGPGRREQPAERQRRDHPRDERLHAVLLAVSRGMARAEGSPSASSRAGRARAARR